MHISTTDKCIALAKSSVRLILKTNWKLLFSTDYPETRKKTAIILGNGPSLTEDLPALLKLDRNAFDLWCVNNFATTDTFFELKPENYVIADPGYWQPIESTEHIGNLLIDTLNNKLSWDMTLFIPKSAKDSVLTKNIKSKFITIVYYNNLPYLTHFQKIDHLVYSRGLGVPPLYNVLIAAIYLCIRAQYKHLILLGADHSWHEDILIKDGSMLLAQKHFYKEDSRHVPVYKHDNSHFSIAELFIRFGNVFHIYEILDAYARSLDKKIFNASSKSYIDGFQRVSLEEVAKDL